MANAMTAGVGARGCDSENNTKAYHFVTIFAKSRTTSSGCDYVVIVPKILIETTVGYGRAPSRHPGLIFFNAGQLPGASPGGYIVFQ